MRDLGWAASVYGNPNSTDLLHIPLAINAGLGQLGKHGSLISKEHGSNVRLATVVTDLPLATDEEVDISVDDPTAPTAPRTDLSWRESAELGDHQCRGDRLGASGERGDR